MSRPDRTVLIRESGDGDKTPLNPGGAVANVPLWASRDVRAAFGPPFFVWDSGTIGSPRRVRTRRAVIAWLLKMYAI